jgi:catechol 2,3-dioxygenase-like lactoylglutathione lyase family enzyme
MQRLALHHVVIFAPDLVAARAFYVDVLGLELKHASARHLQLEGANFALATPNQGPAGQRSE